MPNSLWPHGQQHVYHLQAMLNQYISQLQTSSCQGGWQLSRRIPPSSLERNELKQLLKTQRKGCSLPELTCHGHGLLVSPKLLTTQVCEPEHSEVKQNETGKNKTKQKKKVYCRAKQEEWVICVQNPQTPWWFVGEDVIGKIWGEASENVVLFWLVRVPEFLCSGWSYHPLTV